MDRPPRAGVLGLEGSLVSGVVAEYDTLVYPCPGSLCVGFSRSLYFTQRINGRKMSQVPSLRGAPIIMDRGQPLIIQEAHYYVYVDDLGVLRGKVSDAAKTMKEVKSEFEKDNLLLHQETVTVTGAKVLGAQLDLERMESRVSEERFWKVHNAFLWACRRKTLSGRSLEILIGHGAFCGLSNRLLLSTFCAVYKFIQTHYFEAAPLWTSVKEELRAFAGGLFFAAASWCRQWNPLVTQSDASLGGFGTCSDIWPRQKVAKVGRVLERARFRRGGARRARESALTAAGFCQADNGEWVLQEVEEGSGEAFLKEKGWERD
jgi:hypothetical protein